MAMTHDRQKSADIVSLRKWPYDHWLANKAYLCAIIIIIIIKRKD